MDDYLGLMENYSPNAEKTEQSLGIKKIIEIEGAPETTGVLEMPQIEEMPKYMAPETIEVRRYILKK